MIKKILLASAIAITTSSMAYANFAPYVGGGLGINVNTNSFVPTSYTQSSVNNKPVGPKHIVGGPGNFRGVPLNIFGGYGGVINQSYYLAGELNATVWTIPITENHLKSTYSYGASFIPGIMLSDYTLAYFRAGVVRTHFENGAENKTGGQFGFGMQTGVTQNIDVRGEYDYTAYSSYGNGIGTVDSIRQDGFNVAAVYKFD